MNRQDAEQFLTASLKPIFGFALKRCKSVPDAEDLAQEIAARTFRALLAREDVEDPTHFLWTVAHNTLCNYYRDTAKNAVGVSLDEATFLTAPADDPDDADAQTLRRLRQEIAYLSETQRRIVIAYYFENRKQAEIARELNVPVGTVKWHLFEAKKELKRGMQTMRETSELRFHPIKFDSYGTVGSIGTKSPAEFFRSALAQNLCYSVRNRAKTVNEIADDLGVSPIYVGSEAEHLAEYGFLRFEKGKYLANFLISEPTVELLTLQNEMYRRAAVLFANDLFDALTGSEILDDPGILCGQTDGAVRLREAEKADRNFVFFALIPYIAACAQDEREEQAVSFEEVATYRPDGAHDIYHATILPEHLTLPADYVPMKNWSGPMWEACGGRTLWRVDSEWSDRPLPTPHFSEDAKRVLLLYAREQEDALAVEEYAWLAERGYLKTTGDPDGNFKSAWQVVVLATREIREKLLSLGAQIKEKHRAAFDALKAPYTAAVLDSVPAHLRKVKQYELQFLFRSDGWFLLHCLTALLQNGKLKEPTQGQRKALSMLILEE